MIVGSSGHAYEWIENWAKIPETDSTRGGWAHHGVAVTGSGRVVTCQQDVSRIIVLDANGNLVDSWGSGLTEVHSITATSEGDQEYLWLADNGAKAHQRDGYQRVGAPIPDSVSGQAVKMTLEGRMVTQLERPPLPVYQDGGYSPTSIAVNEERYGGNGDVWVADGYGRYYVHRYDKGGRYVGSINGVGGEAGAFDLPHAICLDTRKSPPELYIADERNRRIQVYDLDGNYKRVFGSEYLTKPSGLGVNGDLMMVMELGARDLRARLWLLDEDDNQVVLLGDNPKVDDTDAWPNGRNDDGDLVRTAHVEPGRFHSPHMLAADADGNIYVAEYLIGGRIIKLARR